MGDEDIDSNNISAFGILQAQNLNFGYFQIKMISELINREFSLALINLLIFLCLFYHKQSISEMEISHDRINGLLFAAIDIYER